MLVLRLQPRLVSCVALDQPGVQLVTRCREVRVMILNHAAQLIHSRILRGILLVQFRLQVRVDIRKMGVLPLDTLVLARILSGKLALHIVANRRKMVALLMDSGSQLVKLQILGGVFLLQTLLDVAADLHHPLNMRLDSITLDFQLLFQFQV